jgi:hypothetical protein
LFTCISPDRTPMLARTTSFLDDGGAVKSPRDLDNVVLSLRLRGAEAVRFWAVLDKAQARNPYADRTDVLRELLGLNAPAVLTAADIEFFRNGNKGDR